MFRQFACAMVISISAACAAVPAAHATTFLDAIEDVPLATGLVEQSEPLIFEGEQGRVVRTAAEGARDAAGISSFYAQTLPALGWKPIDGAGAMAFMRENERLTIRIREAAGRTPLHVDFELVVKLASTRLPD